jgi:hydrogenase expression/formation protein HypC
LTAEVVNMCLAVPARITEINGSLARVDMEGNVREADVSLLEDPSVGDYVMIHAGFAISKYEPEEAQRTLELLRELFNDGG